MKISIKRVQNDACIGFAEREKFGTQFKKYIFMAVAGMLALSSCSNDDNDVQNTQNTRRQMTFTAGFGDEAQTRATLDPSTKAVSFDANDEISILSANNTNTLFITAAGGASASFTGTANDDTKYYAVYPYTDGLTLNSSTGVISGITIPQDQTAAAITSACGWEPAAAIAYATTTGTSLTFHNACALLKVTNGRGTGEIDIADMNSTTVSMTGVFNLNTSDGTLSATNGHNTVFAVNVPNGKTIYIAIAPCTVGRFYAQFSVGSKYYIKEKSSPTTFEAGKIYDLGNTIDWPTY